MTYNPDIHHRRSIRLKGYDYSRAGFYFITLCVQNREHLLGKIKEGELFLNKYGETVEEEWLKTIKIRRNISLGEFIIMPNHFHAIIQIDYPLNLKKEDKSDFKSPSNTIGAIIRGFKGAATKKINILRNSTGELQFAPTDKIAPNDSIWQRNYYEHIIRNEKSYLQISEYIQNNPLRWQDDKYYD